MDTNVTALTVPQRASLALGSSEHETRLKELAIKHVGLIAITNPAGYQDAQSARMELKNTRVDLTHKAKAARDDANAFSAAVIVEEKRLIGIIKPEEDRLEKLQKEWDDKVEAERLAKEKAEEDRKNTLRVKVSEIHEMGLAVVGKPSVDIADQLALVEGLVITDADYAEFVNDARNVRQVTITSLTKLLDATRIQEAEAVRVAAERVELARLRAEKVERDAKDAEERAKLEAERKAQQEKADREQSERLAIERFEQEEMARKQAQCLAQAVPLPSPKIAPTSAGTLPSSPAPLARPAFDSPEAVRSAIQAELEGMGHHDLLLVLDAIRFVKTGEKIAA